MSRITRKKPKAEEEVGREAKSRITPNKPKLEKQVGREAKSRLTRKKPKAEKEVGREAKSSVPEEVYLEILVRLPAKSACACKCVCKSWFQLITNPSFAKMHLNFATKRKHYNLMFGSDDERRPEVNWTINSISYDSLSSATAREREIVKLVGYPFCCDKWSFRFLGSCNGLVGLWYRNGEGEFICLCNPTTKEYKRIPESRYSNLKDYKIYMMTAFGYDCKDDDYKLINVVNYRGSTDQFLDMYTLGSNSWKSNQIIMAYAFRDEDQTGILVNGAFHWFGQEREKNLPRLIISMDINNQKFDALQLPTEVKEILEKYNVRMTIGDLEGCLCLVVNSSYDSFEVWMMQDYAVQESWARVHTINQESISVYFGHTLRLMQSFKNGKLLLMYGSWLRLYDPKHSRGREPKNFSNFNILDAISFVESLVSLGSGTYAGRNNKKAGKMKKKKHISLKFKQ